MRAARRAQPPTASSSCSRSRTARAGIACRSKRVWRSPHPRWSSRRRAPMRCRRRSPPSTRLRRAPRAEAPNWRAIAERYDQLARERPGPVVELNRAIAIAMADGPAVGLALVSELERRSELADYYLLWATEADLLRRLGRAEEAAR